MKKKYKKLKFLYMIIAIIFVFIFQTIAYSSIFSTMTITGDAYARVKADVRVTDFMISEVSSDSISYYEEFGKDHLMTNVSLPSSSSYIIYKVEATNFGSRASGIYSVTLNNSNLKYELIDYTLGTKIYDSNAKKYISGAKQTFYIKISYNTYNSSNTSFDLKINFDFQPFYYIDYYDFNGIYQDEIIGKSNLIVDLSYDNPTKIVVYVNDNISSNYTFNNNILTINNVSSDIIIENKIPYREEILDTAIPVLDENMVPVTWDFDNEEWIVADIYEPWYWYEYSMWANVIIVDNNVNYPPGTPIDVYDESIKQWYVWIPQFIMINDDDVEFVDGPTGKEPDPESLNLIFGNYEGMEEYVHSSFTSLYSMVPSYNVEPVLPGFWVGKFSTSYDDDQYYVLPNKYSYTCTVIECARSGDNVYNSELYDSRMIKNSQWAAIAYLSTSVYGKPYSSFDEDYKEVYMSYYDYSIQNPVTGLSLSLHQMNGSSVSYTFYDSTRIDDKFYANSSTTGNVFGVYDMVSGNAGDGTLVAATLHDDKHYYFSSYDYDLYYTTDGYWNGGCTSNGNTYYESMRGCIDHAMWDTAGWYGDYYFDRMGVEEEFYDGWGYLKRGFGTPNFCDNPMRCAGIFSVYGAGENTSGLLRVVLDMYNWIIT